MKTSKYAALVLVLAICFLPAPASAQVATVAKVVRELVEQFAMAGSEKMAKDLADMGGEKAVQEVIEKAARQGGDELVQQVAVIARRSGPRSLKALEADPALMIKALHGVPNGKIASVIAETARRPELMARLVRAQGDDVLLASTRHPGVGTKIIDEFGEAGLVAAKKLETGDVIILAKTKGFPELPNSAKQQFLDLLRENPQKVAKALVVLAVGGTAIVLTADVVDRIADTILGTPDAPGPMVKPIVTTVWVVGAVLAAALVAYMTIKIWGVAQRTKHKSRKS